VTIEGKIYGQNSKFWQFWGLFPHCCPDNREIWHGPPPTCQILRLSGQRVALRGEKPIFGPPSKNNTDMAALRAILPVIKNYKRELDQQWTIYVWRWHQFHSSRHAPVNCSRYLCYDIRMNWNDSSHYNAVQTIKNWLWCLTSPLSPGLSADPEITADLTLQLDASAYTPRTSHDCVPHRGLHGGQSSIGL